MQPTSEPTNPPLYLQHHSTIASDIVSTPSTTTNDGESDAANAIDAFTSGDFASVPMVFYIIILILLCVVCFLCVGGCVYFQRRKGDKEEKVMLDNASQVDAQSPSAWSPPDTPQTA